MYYHFLICKTRLVLEDTTIGLDDVPAGDNYAAFVCYTDPHFLQKFHIFLVFVVAVTGYISGVVVGHISALVTKPVPDVFTFS